MTSSKTTYEQTIERIQQQILRMESDLRSSQQRFLNQEITIDNRTHQNLNFTIKVSEEDEELRTITNTEGKYSIPYHSSYHHRINSTHKPQQRSRSPSQQSRTSNHPPILFTYGQPSASKLSASREFVQEPSFEAYSPTRTDRKFQPFTRLAEDQLRRSHEAGPFTNSLENSAEVERMQSSGEGFPSSLYSEKIGREGHINELQQYSQAQNLKSIEKSIIPLSISSDQNNEEKEDTEELSAKITHVRNYPTKHYETPLSKNDNPKQIGITFSPKIYLTTREKTNFSKVQPTVIGYQNNKKYFDEVKEKQLLQKAKAKVDSRRRKIPTQTSKSKQKQFRYISQFEHFEPSRKQKADDLFLERKNLFLNKLKDQQDKSYQKIHNPRQRSKSKSSCNFVLNKTSQINPSRRNSRQISPRIKQISERLYSRSKDKPPCPHHRQHSESIDRERFFTLVHQNSFVQKYLTDKEQEDLFQRFRHEEDSVSSWPMKLLNYTYSKLKKINASRYTIGKSNY